MKTTYLRDRKRERSILFILIILISIFVLLYNPVRGAISKVVYGVAPGVWKSGFVISDKVASFFSGFRSNVNISNENKLLREQVIRIEKQIHEQNFLREEVLGLSQALGRPLVDKRVKANVIVGQGRSPYDTLIIDAGTEHGIRAGDSVVYASVGLIGTIVEAYPSSSKAKLFSSPGDEVPVFIGAQSVPTKAKGRGMGNFEAQVPQGSKINIGEEVRSMPQGNLFLGIVGAVEENPAEPFVRVLFRTSFNITEIESVEVLVGPKNTSCTSKSLTPCSPNGF